MFTIMYISGNGYKCGCCRRTDNGYIDVSSIEEAISSCIDLARSSDWDFEVDAIRGIDDEKEHEIIAEISKGISRAEKVATHSGRIKDIEREIRELKNLISPTVISSNKTKLKTLENNLAEIKNLLDII